MGMESFNIMALSEKIKIVTQKGYWSLEENSKIQSNFIESMIEEFGAVRCSDNEWILDNCIEIKEYVEDGYFQGIEVRGCLVWLKEGVDICFELINYISNYLPLKIYILNENVEVDNAQQLYDFIIYYYKDKIEIFRRQYGDVKMKVTSGIFYQEIKKRNSLRYKILHSKIIKKFKRDME